MPKTYSVRLLKKTIKELKTLPPKDMQRLLGGLRLLETNPLAGKPLKGELAGRYSLRVWPYRIVYRIIKQELCVQVLVIAHRQGVYS